jgi:Mn-dependent DtxR family transcriptional regulator
MSDDAGEGQSAAEARSLHDLDVDIAIRLRWVLRDIRAGRIKLLAPSSDDLRSLAELGLVTVDDDKLILTEAGYAAIGSPR